MPITEDAARSAVPPYGFLHDYVAYASQCTDANVAFHLIGGLICLTQTVPSNYGFPLGAGQLRANLYGLCAGPSTNSRKSATIDIARGLLTEAGVGDVAEDPGSAEGLLELVRATPRCLLVWDEFGQFLARTESGYAVPLKTGLTALYDCYNPGRALANKRRGTIENPRVSVIGGSTLDFLERHTEPVDWLGGFMARFLTFYCDREREFTLPPPGASGRDKLVATLQALVSLENAAPGNCQGMTAVARQFWDHWYRATAERAGDAAREVQAGVARAHGMALKIALLLAWDLGHAREAPEWILEADVLQMATRIVDMHLTSVLEIGQHLAPTRDGRACKAVLAVVNGKPVPLSEIILKSKIGLKKRVMDVLSTLEESRQLQRLNIGGRDYYARVDPTRAADEIDADITVLQSAPVLE